MPTVHFTATQTVPRWVHRRGGYDGTRMVDPVLIENGEDCEMDDFEANWLVGSYPELFNLVEEI